VWFRRPFYAREAHENLLGRPVGNEHNVVALGSTRPPRMPTNFIETLDNRRLEELKAEKSCHRLILS
jgi:hypothetical protein